MLTANFIGFLSDNLNNRVCFEIYTAYHKGTLHSDVICQVDINESFQLVVSKPGKDARIVLRPGKLPAMLGMEYDSTVLEAFTNTFRRHVDENTNSYDIEIVSGQDIVDSYRTGNYKSASGNTNLWASCMNDDTDLFSLYSENPNCSLVRLKERGSSRISGRALLWKTESGLTFMDRVYTISPAQQEFMLAWAAKQGFGRKIWQSPGVQEGVFVHGREDYSFIMSVHIDYQPDLFPYMDTFTWLIPSEKRLVNYKPSGRHYELYSSTGKHEVFDEGWEHSGDEDDDRNREDDDDNYIDVDTF